jgi:hypothetical protein
VSMPKAESLRNWVDLKELKERLNQHWYRKKKGAPPVTYAEVYELIRRLEAAEGGPKWGESSPRCWWV